MNYVKIDENKMVLEFAPKNKGSISNYNSNGNEAMLLEDGYTLQEVEQAYNGKYYVFGYAPEKPLADVKSEKMSELDAITQDKIITGFWYQDPSLMEVPLHFSFDTIDQSNFNSAMNGANLYLISQASGASTMTPDSIAWNGYTDIEHQDLVQVRFNAEQFINFWGYAETIHKNAILEQARVYKADVTACTTVECVNAITWE